jgi:hypothetical protein
MENLPEIYFGSEPPAQARILHAGSLVCLYQAGAIRQVRAGETEILRMIYPAIRDPDWGTIPGTISEEEIEESRDSFSIRYDCRYSEGDIDYLSFVRIHGSKDNLLTFSMKGEALSSFQKNRLGLNILHPIRECAGRSCKVTTPDGREYSAEFPVDISPHQPMKNIRSMQWTVGGDIHASLELSGEVFEMEDQRNWTDASYKTYCTPLELPFPAAVDRGEMLEQEVQLKVEVQEFHTGKGDENQVILPREKKLLAFPAVGICKSSETGILCEKDTGLIREVGFRHYRVDLYLYLKGWQEVFARAVEEVVAMDLTLELALFFESEVRGQLEELINQVKKHPCPIDRFLIFTSDHLNDEDLSGAVIPALKNEFPGTKVGTGTNANFAELNRNRPDPDLPDFLTYSIHPQAHASDPLTMVENLAGQKDTVLAARLFPGKKPISVSPVTLKSRSHVDARQPSLFCAGWTLGSFKYLAESGVDSITYYETAGRGGIIHGDHQPLSPGEFMALRGDIYPVYFMFRELLKFKDYSVGISESPHPHRFSCLLLEDGTEQILILANHTASIQTIRLPEGMQMLSAWLLDENSIVDLRAGMQSWQSPVDLYSVSLNPCAVAFTKLISNSHQDESHN